MDTFLFKFLFAIHKFWGGPSMDKHEVAKILEEIALLLELKNENPFKIRAYRNAAHSILNMEREIQDVVQEGTLCDLEGIGIHICEKVTVLVTTGNLPYYEDLKRDTPPGVLTMMQMRGLGAKKAKMIYDKLGVATVEDLKKACLDGKLAELRGFGPKTAENILKSIGHHEVYHEQNLWWDAIKVAENIAEKLRKLKEVKRVEIAGSLRRKKEIVRDIDIVAASAHPVQVMNWFTTQPFVSQITSKGDTKSSILLTSGLQADLRIVPEKQFGYALCYFTGSKEHSIKVRQIANKHGWSLSEYDLSSEDPKKKAPLIHLKHGPSEEEIYKILGMQYIPPELRENMGEIEAALQGKLPKLVEEKDLKGAFHNHTAASDGRNTLEEMVAAAQELGWEYIGISDHSKSSFQANGLSEEKLLTQVEQIKKLNKSGKFSTYAFAGIECDILPNGKLDFSDDILKQLDFVIVSVHSSFKLDEAKMTKRIIKAIENPYSTIVGHLTGRILLYREGYTVNIPKIIDACIANGKIIELNATPNRLDMDWHYWHSASQKGLLCSINPDAHHVDHLKFVQAGVNMARKGWLEKKHIINTRPLNALQKLLKAMR
jgi:DNA polymerase (family X)